MGMISRTPWIFNIWGLSGLHPFWISQEVVRQPWCDLATHQRRSYCASMSRHSPMRLCSKLLLNEHVLCDLHQQCCLRQSLFVKTSHHSDVNHLTVHLVLFNFWKLEISRNRRYFRLYTTFWLRTIWQGS